jgi:hypothetical protein
VQRFNLATGRLIYAEHRPASRERHQGQRGGTVPLDGFREVLIGREASAQIRYDPHSEHLVSRNHARIVRDPADPSGFLITDLGSRNGTFINHYRIYGASRLQHGDRVRLGLDPPPAAPPTRLAEVPRIAPPQTREASAGPAMGETSVWLLAQVGFRIAFLAAGAAAEIA